MEMDDEAVAFWGNGDLCTVMRWWTEKAVTVFDD